MSDFILKRGLIISEVFCYGKGQESRKKFHNRAKNSSS